MVAGVDLDGSNATQGCLEGSWGEDPPETAGEVAAAQDGTLTSTERTPRRRFSGDVFFASKALFEAFRVAISVTSAPGVPKAVPASSDGDGLLAGASIEVLARLGRCTARRQHAPDAPSVQNWRANLVLLATSPG